MTTDADIASLLRHATAVLSSSGIDGAGREARLILQHVAAIPLSTQIAFAERIVPAEMVTEFEAAVARRQRREPLSHILGSREFWSLQFQVTADTLDPRPDSETLVEVVLAQLRQQDAASLSTPLSLVDFGTGTGCLLLSLL